MTTSCTFLVCKYSTYFINWSERFMFRNAVWNGTFKNTSPPHSTLAVCGNTVALVAGPHPESLPNTLAVSPSRGLLGAPHGRGHVVCGQRPFPSPPPARAPLAPLPGRALQCRSLRRLCFRWAPAVSELGGRLRVQWAGQMDFAF